MPEGPEVRIVGDSLDRFTGMTILESTVISGRYIRSAPDMARLVGAVIQRVTVKGKLLVIVLKREDETFAILSTLGMTGWWSASGRGHVPHHVRIKMTLGGCGEEILYFSDQRNFGTFKIVTYAEMKRKLSELGPDIMTTPALWGSITLPEFKARIVRFGKSMTLAEGLLDQRIAAGSGNYIRADAMFLASMSPFRPIIGLNDDELNSIWKALHTIATSSYTNTHPEDAMRPFENLCYGRPESSSVKDRNGRTVWYNQEKL